MIELGPELIFRLVGAEASGKDIAEASHEKAGISLFTVTVKREVGYFISLYIYIYVQMIN